jgi:nitrogen regulatory protein P-II 1
MYLILLVLDNPDQLEDLLIAWEEAGVPSATVLFSTGMGRIRKLATWRDDMPLIPSLRDFYEAPENSNRTVLAVVEDEMQVDAIVAATETVTGSLAQENTGMLLVLPIARAYGARRKSDADEESDR